GVAQPAGVVAQDLRIDHRLRVRDALAGERPRYRRPPSMAGHHGSDELSIEVEGLVVRHGSLVAVDGISFSARPGEVLVVLGPNGAGKTSTVDVLEGYRRPD